MDSEYDAYIRDPLFADSIVFQRGDRVRQVCDPRHVGTVAESVGVRIAVRWDDSEWLSEHRPSELQRDGVEMKRKSR